MTFRKVNKISAPNIIESMPSDYKKLYRSNIKRNAIKGLNFMTNRV